MKQFYFTFKGEVLRVSSDKALSAMGIANKAFPFLLVLGLKMVGLAKDCPSLLAIHTSGLKATFLTN
jgi:hypothetical protein